MVKPTRAERWGVRRMSATGSGSQALARLLCGVAAAAGLLIGSLHGALAGAPAAPPPPVRSSDPPALPEMASPPDVNPAGLTIDLDPGRTILVGQAFHFTLTTRRAGYLLILDVNAEGIVTQIYPNVFSLKVPRRAPEPARDPCGDIGGNTLSSYGFEKGSGSESNRMEADRPFTLPGTTGRADYAFQACPPAGNGFVAAILSDRPVQMIDLPDMPPALVGKQAGFDRLIAGLRSLRILSSDSPTGEAGPARWSIAVKTYRVIERP